MRVLLTVHQFLPDHFGGTETLTYWTAGALRSLGHEVRVLTASLAPRSDASPLDSYEVDGLPVYRFTLTDVLGQRHPNAVEVEYDNPIAAGVFREILAEFPPDVVHFFHLHRLSASLIDVCRSARLPMVLTATDYWFLCPTTHLRLPDSTPCAGPDAAGVNCLRHFLLWTGRTHLASIASALPDGAVAAGITACGTGILRNLRFPARVRALAARRDFLRQRLNAVDRVLVPTRFMERLLTDQGLEPTKTLYCPFGIAMGQAPAPRPCSPRPMATVLRIGFIGTLVEHKGLHILIAAVRKLAALPVELKIYGRGDDFPDYASRVRAQAAGDTRIGFLGTFANDQIGEVFAGLDVLVVPSLWYENTPLVIYSAQAHGCPLVATNLEGLSEAVTHEDNGLVFPLGDVDDLCKALERLLREPDLLVRLRNSARAPKTIAQYAADCLAVYHDVIAERRPLAGA